jgi:hypothetical protein
MPERVGINSDRNAVDSEALSRNCYTMREIDVRIVTKTDQRTFHKRWRIADAHRTILE